MRNLIIRTSVAAVTIPIILWISYRGGLWLIGMVGLFAMLAMFEFVYAEGYRPRHVLFWIGPAWLGAVLYGLWNAAPAGIIGFESALAPFWMPGLWSLGFVLVGGMIFAVGKQSPEELFNKYTRYLWGVLYITALYPFVVSVGQGKLFVDSGGDNLLFLFGLLWVGDTAAMGFGKWLGKHKLAPTVSPNKTVEGFVGGIIGAAAIGVLMIFWKFSAWPWYHVLILAVGCSVFGQLGDLVESMWKRSLGIKDSSSIIPGHGGVLDRFDSLLFAAPFMFFYLVALSS
ncbi:MAG: phosphatidate cytidylyltransferase [Candidatus Zixiibacteriota bacterium]|nr:MAG: phosphatidate cytidylyltransferase [candidate division Zixibacteria bacterium]